MNVTSNTCRFVIIASILSVFFTFQQFSDTEFGYTVGSTWEHFTFSFFHGNIFHLLGNLYGLFLISDGAKTRDLIHLFIVGYIAAVASSYIAVMNIPTLGMSGILYFIFGFAASKFHKKNYPYYILIAYFIFGLFHPAINGIIHISCFSIGVGYKFLLFFFKSIRYDYKRVG